MVAVKFPPTIVYPAYLSSLNGCPMDEKLLGLNVSLTKVGAELQSVALVVFVLFVSRQSMLQTMLSEPVLSTKNQLEILAILASTDKS